MSKDNNHIERIFRNKFSDYSVTPSKGVWSKLAGKLFWKDFLSFDISSFNVYYLSAIAGVAITGAVLLTKADKIAEATIEEPVGIEQAMGEKAKAEAPTSSTKTVDTAGKKASEDEKANEVVSHKNEESKEIETIERSEEDNLEPVETKDKASSFAKAREDKKAEENKKVDLKIKPPVPDYTASSTQGCGNLTVQFTNRSRFAESYVWHFGDGGTSTEENPTYIYDEPGEYEVRLEAKGAEDQAIIAKETIRVFEPPEANFVISPEDVTIPEEPVTFYNQSKNASRYRWDFGDLSTSTETEPIHYYMTEGKFDVRLDVWNEAECHDSMIVQDAFAGSGCRIEFPTAFAPNPNGPSNGYYTDGPTGNEVFHPVCQGVVEYRLRIYNRNGVQLFESNEVNIGWDGYIKGALAKQDVYVWKVSGRFRNGKTFTEQGNVTLIVKR